MARIEKEVEDQRVNFRRAEIQFRLEQVARTREAWERAGCPSDWRWNALKKALASWVDKEAEPVT